MVARMADRIWRGLGTALFLSIIGLGGTFLSLTVFPVIYVFTDDQRKRRLRAQTVLHYAFRVYLAAIRALRLGYIEFFELERLSGLRGHIIIANHPSLLDVVMIMACVRDVQCVVKAGLWSQPFFRMTVRGAGFIRNDLPPEALLRACCEALESGQNLIVFPEGTRTPPNANPKPQRGFANLALFAKADLQMLTISCEPPILYKGSPWWRVPVEKTRISLTVGERVQIAPFLEYGFNSIGARKLTSFVENYYRRNDKDG